MQPIEEKNYFIVLTKLFKQCKIRIPDKCSGQVRKVNTYTFGVGLKSEK